MKRPLAHVIMKKYKGNMSRFIRESGIRKSDGEIPAVMQVSRWIERGVYIERGELKFTEILATIERGKL